TALEIALKLKEVCSVPAVGLSYADLVHGPIAILDPQVPALLVAAADGPMLPEMTALAPRVAAPGPPLPGVGAHPGSASPCHTTLPVPPGPSGSPPWLPEHLAPFGLVVPGQLLAEALARAKGLDPDAPRGRAQGRPT